MYAAIVPHDLLASLRAIPPTYARFCTFCGATIPQAPGHPRTWTTDGACLDCYVATRWRGKEAPSLTLAMIPDAAADDEMFSLPGRIPVYLQKRGAATKWVPITVGELADKFSRSRCTISRNLSQLVKGGYLEAQPYSGKHGGRCKQYKAILEPKTDERK